MPITPLNKEYTNVTTGATTHEGVAIRLLPNRTTADIVKGTEVIESLSGVTNVVDVGPQSWLIEFDDGTRWRIDSLKRPCGCGG